MAKNELLPFANGEDANVLPTNQWEALTDILENGFQSGIARSEQVNRVLSQGAVASYVLGQLIVDQLSKDATLDKDTLYQNLVSALQENAKDACLPLSGGNVTGNLTVQSKNVVRAVNGTNADANGNVTISVPATPKAYVTETWKSGTQWYRKWSDGWIEQGGEVTHNHSQVAKTVTFALRFSNTNYTVVAQTINKTAVAYGDGGTFIFSKTTTSFQTTQVGYGANDVKANWYACGY